MKRALPKEHFANNSYATRYGWIPETIMRWQNTPWRKLKRKCWIKEDAMSTVLPGKVKFILFILFSATHLEVSKLNIELVKKLIRLNWQVNTNLRFLIYNISSLETQSLNYIRQNANELVKFHNWLDKSMWKPSDLSSERQNLIVSCNNGLKAMLPNCMLIVLSLKIDL